MKHDNRTTLLQEIIRDVEIATLTKLYRHAKGKKISLETLGEPFDLTKQTLHNHVKRDA